MTPPHPVDRHPRARRAWLRALVAACAVVAPAVATRAAAQGQPYVPPPQQLPFTRPESWALGYFTSATLISGLETPADRKPGDVSLGIEFGWLPHLSSTEELVGFNGIHDLDMNQAPFMPRPRITIGLPARFSVIVAGVPPIPMFGLKAALIAVGLERPLVETSKWTVGLRGYGQLGHVQGAYTCPASQVAFAPGSPENIMGCDATSSDVATLRYVGGEASVAYRQEAAGRFSPHAAIGVAYMDVGFQVRALTYGYPDRTHYLSRGTAVSFSGGFSYNLSSRFTLGTDVFYTPLYVRRGLGAPLQEDGFFNVRALISYRLR